MATTNEMEAKLQALFQTMVAESVESSNVMEEASSENTHEIVIQENGVVRFASQADDKENDQLTTQIITNLSPEDITTTETTVYEEVEHHGNDPEMQEEQQCIAEENVIVEHGMEEEIESEEDAVKLVFQTNLEKPLQSGILKGLNRLNGFPCSYCSRVLATKYSLMIHTRIHTGEKPHHCTVCTSKFTHPTDLRRHMLKHTGEKPFKCDVCGAGFTQTTSLKGHSRQHPGEKPHKCQICGETFVAAVLLKTHERIHNQVQTFKCTHCDETYESIEQVMEHCQNFHTISVSFDQVQAAANKNQPEPTALVDVSTIMYGRKRKRGHFACDECDSVLTTAYSLQIHKRTHTGERPYACHLCDYRSICLSMLKRHVLTHSSEKPFQCEHCPKSFRQLPHLKKHQQIHENKQRKCRKCDNAYPKLSDLVSHWNAHHSDADKPFLCVDCFTEFEEEDELLEHKKEKHAWKQGEYACDRCGTVFNRKGNLKKHLERVDCSERPFACELCEQTFRKKKSVEEHMLRDHGVEKDYECQKCKKVFKMEKLLKMHEKRTHGVVKCYCTLCPQRVFSSHKDLMDHTNRKHVARLVQVDITSTVKNKPTSPDEKDVTQRLFKVTNHVNGKIERTKEKMGKRRPKKAITKPRFPCRICGQLFTTHREVLHHFQSHRKNPGYFPSEEDFSSSSSSEEEMEREDNNQQPSTTELLLHKIHEHQQTAIPQHHHTPTATATSLQPLKAGQLRATLSTEDVPDIGNYVLVELMGDEDGNMTVAEQQATMNAVVKQLLEEAPAGGADIQSQLNEIAKSGTVVAELVLNNSSSDAPVVEVVQDEKMEEV